MDALKSAKYTGHWGTKQNDRVAHAAVANARGQCAREIRDWTRALEEDKHIARRKRAQRLTRQATWWELAAQPAPGEASSSATEGEAAVGNNSTRRSTLARPPSSRMTQSSSSR